MFSLNPDFSVDYSPNNGFTGLDTFRYELCDTTLLPGICDSGIVIITVDPEAVADTFIVTTEVVTTIAPLANDTANLLVTTIDTVLNSGPKNGVISLLPDGSMTYESNPEFFGTDSVLYEICDTSTSIKLCDSAYIYFHIIPLKPDAIDDASATKLNESVTISILNNDIILNPTKTSVISASVITSSNANVILNPDTTLTYTPFLDFRGLDTLTYILCDTTTSIAVCDTAQVIIMVGLLAVDDSTITSEFVPITFLPLANDTINPAKTKLDTTVTGGPKNGVLTIDPATGQILYASNTGFTGRDTVEFLVCDTSVTPNICDTSIFIIRVLPAPPLASNDTVQVFKNQKTTYDILDNDIIPNPDPTKYTLTVLSANGSLIKDSDTTLTYTPQLDFIGSDSARYVLCDTSLIPPICDTAWVFFNVIEKPSPLAVDDISATPLNTDVTIDVLINDLFPDPLNTIAIVPLLIGVFSIIIFLFFNSFIISLLIS